MCEEGMVSVLIANSRNESLSSHLRRLRGSVGQLEIQAVVMDGRSRLLWGYCQTLGSAMVGHLWRVNSWVRYVKALGSVARAGERGVICGCGAPSFGQPILRGRQEFALRLAEKRLDPTV